MTQSDMARIGSEDFIQSLTLESHDEDDNIRELKEALQAQIRVAATTS